MGLNKRRDTYVPKEKKPVAAKRFGQLRSSFQNYRGHCLFVINEDGKLCSEPAVNCHAISKRNVLGLFKDISGKVLEFNWSPQNWTHLFMQSSPEHPIDLSNPSVFEPQPIGIDKACTGTFACNQHDQQFNRIDFQDLDFTDHSVSFLAGYRAVLYDTALIPQGESFLKHWDRMAMRHQNRAARTIWITYKRKFFNTKRNLNELAKRLGISWYKKSSYGDYPLPIADKCVQSFRSTLHFAASLTYKQDVSVTVLPGQDNLHKISVVSWTKGSKHFSDLMEALGYSEMISMPEDASGVCFMERLMRETSGVAAMSPDSLQLLHKEDRLRIDKLLMDSANPWVLKQMFSQG